MTDNKRYEVVLNANITTYATSQKEAIINALQHVEGRIWNGSHWYSFDIPGDWFKEDAE